MNEYTQIFLEGYGDTVFEPVEEGWGTALLQVGVFTSLIGSTFALSGEPLGFICIGTTLALATANSKNTNVSDETVTRIMNVPKMKQYILKECDNAWKQAQSKYRNNQKWELCKRPSNAAYDGWAEEEERMAGSNRLSGVTHYSSYHSVGSYHVELYADSDHIDGVKVVFMLKAKTKEDKELEPYRLVKYTLQSPTREDIKAMGYYKGGILSL